MKIYAETSSISREEWLKLRTEGIGGSDVSIVAGINPYKSVFQLWMEKTGLMIPVQEENEYLHFGTVLEPVVRQEFIDRTGIQVRQKNAVLQHPEHPFMFANLDGIVLEENGGLSIFEAKTASAYKAKEWENHVPEEYQLQIQHYMAVTGAGKAYIAALIGGNQFVWHTVCRDEELIQLIIKMEKQFWEEHVLTKTPPELDGSEATSRYINQKYAESVANTIELPQEALILLDSYDNLTEQIKKLTLNKDKAVNKLKEFLQENEKGYIEDRIVKWNGIQKDQFDQKRLKAEEPGIYGKYVTKTSYRRFQVA